MTSHPRADDGALPAEQPKGPWVGNDTGQGSGPRNPWAVPPKGSRQTALDDFIKRARAARGGGGGGGGGSGLPTPPTARLLWGIGAATLVAGWLALTSVHPIGPQQRGVVTWFGRYAGTLDPGFHVTLPAPIATVTKVNVDAVTTTDLPGDSGARPLLTRDQGLVEMAYSARWSVVRPVDYLFDVKDPERTVAALTESGMREAVAGATLAQVMSEQGRSALAAQVREATQKQLDRQHAGIRVNEVVIRQADAPDGVQDAARDIGAAQAQAQADRAKAEQYRQQKLAAVQAETGAFDAFYAQYKLAPDATRRRLYYDTMEQVLANNDKTIVEANGVAPILPLGHVRRLPDQAPPAGSGQ